MSSAKWRPFCVGLNVLDKLHWSLGMDEGWVIALTENYIMELFISAKWEINYVNKWEVSYWGPQLTSD